MMRLKAVITLSALILLPSLAGCQQLQLGYYLTPENYPGAATRVPDDPQSGLAEVPTQELSASATPPSTVLAVATDTPTPSPTFTETPLPTETPIPCTETAGQVVTDSFISQATGAPFHYRVYLPPCYATSNRRYPYLIMMHGLGDGMNDDQWDRMGLDEAEDSGINAGTLAPMIIVMPNGTDANYSDYNGLTPFPDIVVDELMPLIESQYCTWNDRDMRAIGGLSRGGFYAYYIAFSHPDLFSKVGGHSPYFYPASYASEKNPDNLVDTAPGIEQMTYYMDYGPDDYPEVFAGVDDMISRLAARGISVIFVQNPSGGHTENYWSSHVSDYLAFYSTDWPHSLNDLPSCHEPSPGGGS